MAKAIQISEEAVEKVREFQAARYEEYKSQREDDIDKGYSLADWFYSGGTARIEWNAAKSAYVPTHTDVESNVGSMLFNRQVNTKAGLLSAIMNSGRPLVNYVDRGSDGEPLSEETGQVTADCMNALTKWVMKADGFSTKIPEFCTSVHKLSNIFALITIRREERTIHYTERTKVPTGETDPETGEPIMTDVAGPRKKKGVVFNFPSVSFPHPQNVFCNKLIPTIQGQDCVIITSITSLPELKREGKWFDADALASIDPKRMQWDGTEGAVAKEGSLENRGRDDNLMSEGRLLRFDSFVRVPIMNGEWVDWEEDTPIEYELFWTTFVGNGLGQDAVCLKAVSGFDPDDEIPLEIVRSSPDRLDMLYHMFDSEKIKSVYIADCMLMNSAVDQSALLADPPTEYLEGGYVPRGDIKVKPGAQLHVRERGAVSPMRIFDNTQSLVALRQQVREDAKMAMATDDARVGEYAGARTTKYEVMRVTGATDSAVQVQNDYIVSQFCEWLGRKYLSYIDKYMEPEQITRIIGQMLPGRIIENPVLGDYDVVVDVVHEYFDDIERKEGLGVMLQAFGQVPQLLQSPSHQIDMCDLVKEMFRSFGLPSRLVRKRNNADSEAMARGRVQMMLSEGVFIPPQQGEDHGTHERVARAEALRWKGLENSGDPRAANVPLLLEYAQACKQMDQQEQQQMMQQQQAAQAQPEGMEMQGGGY